MARRRNWSICRTRKIHIYLWELAVYEHVVGDGEATLLIIHLDYVLQAELDGVAREFIHGDPEGIPSITGILVHELRAVLQRLDLPDEPAHGEVKAGQTRLYEPFDPPYCARSVEVRGKGGMGSPCRNFSGGSIHEFRVRHFLARQRNVGAVKVCPLPVLAVLVADDVGEPPARSNLEAYGAAVPKLLLTMSSFTFNG